MPPHAAPGTNVVEGLEPAIRRDHHQRRLSADSDICKVAATDAVKRHNRLEAARHGHYRRRSAASLDQPFVEPAAFWLVKWRECATIRTLPDPNRMEVSIQSDPLQVIGILDCGPS